MKHRQINASLALLVAALAAGIAIDEGTSPLLLIIFAVACGYTALVGAGVWRKHRARLRRHLTSPSTVARRTRKGARK